MIRRLVARVAVDRLITAVSLIAVVAAGVWYTRTVETRLECQARYNEVNNQRTRILTEVSDRERASSRRVVDAQAAVSRHPAAFIPRDERTPEQRREVEALARAWGEASVQQQQDRIDADKARAENPVPPPPSEVCS
jgi:hypothetical protein